MSKRRRTGDTGKPKGTPRHDPDLGTIEAEVKLRESAHRYKRAADKGDPVAQNKYGLCLKTGNGVACNISEAVQYFKMSADQGNADGQFNYGLCLLNGEGVPRDMSEGARYMKMSADQGNANAQLSYAVCAHSGAGVVASIQEAVRYMKMSADQGNSDAQLNYATLLMSGMGVPRNVPEALRYMKMSADQWNPMAQLNYGAALISGMGVTRNVPEGVRYVKMAADQGNVFAQFNYGACLITLLRWQDPGNASEGARYLKMSADQGLPDGQLQYGWCLHEGIGVSRDFSEAARYFKMSADQGHPIAMVNYGFCLQEGEGVPRDLSEAARYLKMSADQGNPMGQRRYGRVLEKGLGVPQDSRQAEVYFKMADEQTGMLGRAGEMFCLSNGDESPFEPPSFAEFCKMRAEKRKAKAAEKARLFAPRETFASASHDEDVPIMSFAGYAKKKTKPLSEWIVDMNDIKKVSNELIQGGSGTIQVFKRKSDGKIIVGKFLLIDDSGDNEIRFKRELSSLFGLDHPCIVKFAGYILPCPSTDHRFLLFTEYVSGGSLAHVIEESDRCPWFNSTIRSIIVLGIVFGMKYVHSRGLFHRDLKPSNVLLDEDHYPHLCDFGSSRTVSDDVTMTGLPPVTIYYAAPELCDEDVTYNEKIDVYSFGMTLYEIVTGKLALRHLNQMQVPAFIIRGKRPEIPKGVLPFTRDLIKACWSQDPSERPSFEEIHNYLKNGDFRLFDDIDRRAVSSYERSLCEWERKSTK